MHYSLLGDLEYLYVSPPMSMGDLCVTVQFNEFVIYTIFVTLCNLLFTKTTTTSQRGILKTFECLKGHRISVLERTLNAI